MLVDVHCHLDFDSFTDLDEVVERAKKAGVVSIITNGTSKKSNR
jgi:Tat protein secretion system quality control protein TatD with DNase activity